MDNTILELAKELADKSLEIGRLTEQVKQKDLIIAGLVAQFSQNKECSCSKVQEQEPVKVNELGYIYTSNPEVQPTSNTVIEEPISQQTVVAPVTTKSSVKKEKPKQKRKYTKRSDFWNGKNSSESPAVVNTVSQKGGTVFKNFDPLDLNKVVVEGANTSAYIVPNSKREYADKISAIAAGLGSSNNI